MSNAVLGQTHQVQVNLLRTCNITQSYIDKDDPCSGILSAAAFEIHSTTNRIKRYSTGQLVFFRDMILPIKHTVDWELIRQQKQIQINKNNICKNRHTVDHKYKVGDNIMLTKYTAYKYETQYTDPFVITQYFTNVKVESQYGVAKIRYNIRRTKPYKSDTNLEDINTEKTYDGVNI